MRKSFIAMLLAVACCLAACTGEGASQSELISYDSQESYTSENSQESVEDGEFGEDSQDSQTSQETTSTTAPYTAENLKTIFFTDVEKSTTVDISDNGYLKTLLLGMEYQEDTVFAPEDVKYVLALQGMDMQIYANGVVDFTMQDETTCRALVLSNEFAYLEDLLADSVVDFSGCTSTQNIQVWNAQSAEGTIADKADFLTKLQAVSVVGLNHKEHYEIGAKKYTIKIDGDEIVVYGKYITYNGDLYKIQQGNFDFLKSLQFGSTVEGLPWL